jgi:hypothetical protein
LKFSEVLGAFSKSSSILMSPKFVVKIIIYADLAYNRKLKPL